MARKQHISRLAGPPAWPIKRKGIKWITKPSPGPHTFKLAMPLGVILRDMLNLAANTSEIKKILNKRAVKINEKVRTRFKFSVGLFDVISIPEIKKYYRVVLNKKGKLQMIEIPAEEARILPLKIVDKKSAKGGKTQINLNNGWNILSDATELKKDETVLIDTERNSILKELKLKPGSVAYIIGGSHIGYTAVLQEVKTEGVLRKKKVAVLAPSPKEKWDADLSQIIIIGEKKPEIKVEQ